MAGPAQEGWDDQPAVVTVHDREQEIAAFLARHGGGSAPAPLADDASFRRYWRVETRDVSTVLMDAPPGKEDVGRFVAVANYLRSVGFSAPEILAADPERGFVLLEDFGDEKLSTLAATGRIDWLHYEVAVDLLTDLHSRPPPSATPPYDETLLLGEVSLFIDWYLPGVAEDPAPAVRRSFVELWRQVLRRYTSVRDVLVLLDYHADNLMWLAGRNGLARLGLLDFQDAVAGHPAYDLVSLLEDARLDVDAALAETMFNRYLTATERDPKSFGAAFAILGAQRNSKIIGIFTRLAVRDGKRRYLDLIPRVWRYLERDLAHPELAQLRDWYQRYVPPGVRDSAVSSAMETGR